MFSNLCSQTFTSLQTSSLPNKFLISIPIFWYFFMYPVPISRRLDCSLSIALYSPIWHLLLSQVSTPPFFLSSFHAPFTFQSLLSVNAFSSSVFFLFYEIHTCYRYNSHSALYCSRCFLSWVSIFDLFSCPLVFRAYWLLLLFFLFCLFCFIILGMQIWT